VTRADVSQVVPFFTVRDIQASVRFYVDGLGFTMTKQWIDDGAGKVGVGVSLAFICADAVTIYRDVTARGLAAQRPFVGNGMWVTQLRDPDGYDIVFESATDVPEETVLPP